MSLKLIPTRVREASGLLSLFGVILLAKVGQTGWTMITSNSLTERWGSLIFMVLALVGTFLAFRCSFDLKKVADELSEPKSGGE